MTELLDIIRARSESWGSPYEGPPVPIKGRAVPTDYWAVLKVANGFTTRQNLFRLFPLGSGADSVEAQNQAEWCAGYGALLQDFVVIADDVFGDLYGYRVRGAKSQLAKFLCEGGEIELCKPSTLSDFLREQVLTERPSAFDAEFAAEAFESGLTCSASEHLAFTLPLIAGGEYSLDNLGVESRELHLGTLGQISVANSGLPDGTEIARFREE